MEERRCRTHTTSVWRLTSQTDRTASCVKRRVLARPTSTTADSATQKGDPPAAASAPPPRLGVVPTALQTIPLHTSSARNNRCPAGTEHYKTKPLPYSPTWKRSRRCTDRRQGTEPTAHPIHRELKRLNGQYRQPPFTGSPVWTRDQSPSSAADLKTAATATPGRPLHRHLQTAPVPPPPLPAPAAPTTSSHHPTHVPALSSPTEEILVVNVHSLQTASPVTTKPRQPPVWNHSIPRTPTMPLLETGSTLRMQLAITLWSALTARPPPQHAMPAATSEHPGAPTPNHHPIMPHSPPAGRKTARRHRLAPLPKEPRPS